MDTPFDNLIKKDDTTFPRGVYDPFPHFKIKTGSLQSGYEAIFSQLQKADENGCSVILFEGYNGVDWRQIESNINTIAKESGYNIEWFNINSCLLPNIEIEDRVKKFLGGDDPIWGTHFPMGLELFMDPEKIGSLRKKAAANKNKTNGELFIIYGCGSSIIDLSQFVVYFDIPKDRIQEIARNENLSNIGSKKKKGFGYFYKRSYFIDWPAQNRIKKNLLPDIDLLVDFSQNEKPTFISGKNFRKTLHLLSETPFRVRPWFYPGPWGGKFMQGHMGLDPNQPNFAWSFEMIAPENGITLKSGDCILEFSFDFIMYQENKRVLGENVARRFQYEWPIRMDYLDTINGGHLSTQCHPRPKFMIENFGETYTQDETYYISVAKEDAKVFLGIKKGVDKEKFKSELLKSENKGTEVKIDDFVNSVNVKPHDLILIPNGTVHCSGEGNLVLEISATPYIFTFKIYDYLRRDLNGNLRKLNIERAFENIREERDSTFINNNYLPNPKLINNGKDWEDYELYNREESFYNINRLEFYSECHLDTEGKGLLINLVEGKAARITAPNSYETTLNLYETMIIPAAAGRVKINNIENSISKIVYTFVRESALNRGLNNPYS